MNYPKIPWYGKDTPNKPCIAFEKYDGTNLSWDWKVDQGFTTAKTRRRAFDASDPDFGEAIPLFNKLAPSLEEIFKKE
jgi:hypothetical protein